MIDEHRNGCCIAPVDEGVPNKWKGEESHDSPLTGLD